MNIAKKVEYASKDNGIHVSVVANVLSVLLSYQEYYERHELPCDFVTSIAKRTLLTEDEVMVAIVALAEADILTPVILYSLHGNVRELAHRGAELEDLLEMEGDFLE